MKQIRIGVFETNSSSTHSISICTKDEFEKLEKGIIEGLDNDLVESYESFTDCDYLESYKTEYVSNSGDHIVVFGNYGQD